MKKNKVIVAVIFILALYSTISAISDDGGHRPVKPETKTEVVKSQDTQLEQASSAGQYSQQDAPKRATIAQLEGYALKNVWPDQEKEIDVAEHEKMKKDFADKAKKIGIVNEKSIRVKYWNFRVNINELNKLRELGADTVSYQSNIMTMLDHAMYAQSVIIGTVKDVQFSSGTLKTTYEIIVEEVLTGNDLYKEFPKTVFVKFAEKLDDPNTIYLDGGFKYHKIGNKYMFFLQRVGLDGYARYDNLKISKEINQQNIFTSWVSFDISDINSYKKTFNNQYKKEFEFEELKEKIIMIGKLNDKSNFFNRSYK